MYKDVSSKVDFIKLEHKQLKFWEKQKTFDKLREQNKDGERWSFLDGPITANNPMGVHHAWGRTLKDVFNRYHSMLGQKMRYQNGFDCQGLWVEVEVEKELGFKSKTDIEKYGIEKFVQACKDRVKKYSKVQTEQSKRLGYWMDWENSYFTMADENNYTIWHFLKKCYERNLIYKGHDVMPWCPKCGSAMSEHEIATEGYKDLTHPTIFAKFYLKDRPKEALLVWTTTPWTLAANTAAAVNVDLKYVKVKQNDEYYYLAKNLTDILNGEYEIIEEFTGDKLLGLKYTGPFDELPAQKGVVHKVIRWDEVSEDDGTGIVHIAPGCGKEDFALSKENDISVIAPINEFGIYLDGFGELTGKNAQKIASEIFATLKSKEILYKRDQITHRYPTCWRHGTELVFRLVDEWFISMDVLREEIKKVVGEITWIPSWGYDREIDWLNNMSDWMISKKRYWGLSLPIWECDECHNFEVIGGKDELKERVVDGWEQFEGKSPHKPYIDNLKIKCSKCGAKMNRIPDVGNPWLDAGIVPFSTMNYISDHDYWEKWFPADFITESLPGQFRNWFYVLLAMSTVLENTAPFKTVLGHALVRDEKGKDMHKSAGNSIPFQEAADKMGVDVMRWIYSAHNPEHNLNFGYKIAKDARKKMLTLWNIYSFYITYAEIDSYDPTKNKITNDDLTELDKWVLSKTFQFVEKAKKNYDEYKIGRLMRDFEVLIDNISNWYVRRSRRRFWKSENDTDKYCAYHTLFLSLKTMILTMAPVIPFVTDEIYQNIVLSVDKKAPESIHLNSFPKIEKDLIDEKLSAKIDTIIKMVGLGRASRDKKNLRIRQPLGKIFLKLKNEHEKEFVLDLKDQILGELNIKNLEIVDNVDEFLNYEVKLNFALLGKKIGKGIKTVAKALETIDTDELVEKIKTGESIFINDVKIAPNEFIIDIKEKKDYSAIESNGYFAIIETTITNELKEEGIVRDLIRNIQTLRKEADFNVEDRIMLGIKTCKSIDDAIKNNKEYLKTETLTKSINKEVEIVDIEKEIKLNGESINISIQKVERG